MPLLLLGALRTVWSLRRDRQFLALALLTTVAIASGTGFYSLVQGLRVVDALYFSVITLTTVGYGDFAPETDAEKLFTVVYVLVGIGILLAFVATLAANLAQSSLRPPKKRAASGGGDLASRDGRQPSARVRDPDGELVERRNEGPSPAEAHARVSVTTPEQMASPRVGRGAGELKPEDHVLVLFGANGDLARRKLLPGLFHLAEAGLLPEHYRIVTVDRGRLGADGIRFLARAAVGKVGRARCAGKTWHAFSESLSYVDADEGAAALRKAIARAEDEIGGDVRRLHYLSVPPFAMAGIVAVLGTAGLAERARVVLEKPFGTDLASARRLNKTVHAVFDESQIFRIDHFLGKEAVQNILALRFANGMFEPVWNREHIDHVQIDVPETLSIENRAGFYEGIGAFRDMVVTHLFQLLGVVAMEPPASMEAKALVDEKTRVFDAMAPLRPEDVVRGQYEGYLDEEGVAADSDTETFVALEARVENWRWAGVPFYLRTGKRMAEERRVVTVAFRKPPLAMFPDAGSPRKPSRPNELALELSEPGSITMSFLAKVPGPTLDLGSARLKFDYEDSFLAANQLEAYERLIHDAMIGDHTLFTRADGIERLWEISMPVLQNPSPIRRYTPGSWGPEVTQDLIAPRRWKLPDAETPEPEARGTNGSGSRSHLQRTRTQNPPVKEEQR